MKQIKYWGSYIGMTFGLTLLSSLLMTVLSFFRGGMEGLSLAGIGMYYVPYLFFAGLFCTSFALLSCFQVYAPTVLAMGCTRKRFLIEVLAVALAEALALVGVSGLLGGIGTRAMASISLSALGGMLGVILIAMAAFLLFGAMILVLGRKGIVVMMILYAIIGGVFGAMGAAIGVDLDTVTMTDLLRGAAGIWNCLLSAGCGLFCLCGVVVWLVLRRYEVRS